MKPAPFTYHAPQTLDEAAMLLRSLADQEPRILAGGQSLVPTMALRLARPTHLVDINNVAGLDGIHADRDTLRIGAMVRHARFESRQSLTPEGPFGAIGPLLRHVAHHIAHYPIRQRGTFGGSLANADPASEWCLVAATFDAVMTMTSAAGVRALPAADFFQGVMTTALAEDEILSAITLTQTRPDTRWGFEEFATRAGDFAQAMTLVAFDLTDGVINNARIGIGGVEAFPLRMTAAEQLLNGAAPSPDLFAQAGQVAGAALAPVDDWQAPEADKQALAGALVQRTLSAALEASTP